MIGKQDKISIDQKNLDAQKTKESNYKNFITVFVDGSFCDKSLAWGVGIWIRNGEDEPVTFSKGGNGIKNSTEVEKKGLSLVKDMLLKMTIANKIIVIQCDNVEALNQFDFKLLKLKGAKFVKLKHVRAHSREKTNRTYINNLVDELAYNEMIKYR